MHNLDDYLDKIDEWHDMDDAEFALLGSPPLYEYLGMTWEEYKEMVEHGTRGLY
jgi:hypothetical protein